jgi:hypothetical protein
MASLHREAIIGASADLVWDAVRDVGQVHKRVVPGFLTDCRMEEGARVVTFFNGMVARELIVDLDEKARRLVWSARNERLEHHNASLQVFDIDGLATCRVVWIADVLPHAAAQIVGALMDEGLACMRKTLAPHSAAA